MGEIQAPSVAVIIPAFNEEARIGVVLQAVLGSKLATEIIVVSDGSTDRTVQEASKFPDVKVIGLRQNVGKGGAMVVGVRSTKAKVLVFVDADLSGLRPEHVDQIVLPILADECEMCIGVFRGGKMFSDAAHRISPYLSGQRAMKRSLFDSVPFLGELRMGVEMALTQAARRRKVRVLKVVLRGVSNCHKEQKMGIMKGLQARGKMYFEITEAMVRTRRRRRRQNWNVREG